MGFAQNWLRQVSPLLHMTTLTTGSNRDGMRTMALCIWFSLVNLPQRFEFQALTSRSSLILFPPASCSIDKVRLVIEVLIIL